MRIETTTRIVVTDELGHHLATAEITERKDVGGNPRFFLPEGEVFVSRVAERAMLTAACGIDRERSKTDA